MTFNSFVFYIFLLAVIGLHYMLPARFRWAWLLICSYVFYGFSDLRFAAVLLAAHYSLPVGRMIENSGMKREATPGAGLDAAGCLAFPVLLPLPVFVFRRCNAALALSACAGRCAA